MLFSSLTFLLLFLPIVVIVYYIFPNRTYRNLILFISSVIFYSWGEPVYIFLMFISIANDYLHALLVDFFNQKKMRRLATLFLISSLAVNLGLLGYFKYYGFIFESFNNIFNSNLTVKEILLPIGISFYTFQTMSYTIDVYLKRVKVQKNILTLATYVAMFPQLIAGPIVRYQTIEDELENRKETIDDVGNGLRRFIIGLAKKIIIANQMAIVADIIFSKSQAELNIFIVWLGVISYAFQIYYDFSGYSDMAIGLGKMFGFNFLENFNYPYISTSITDFWRRWHISLGTWFRDYIYIPLGGNKKGMARWLINVLIVWFITGLWHGASWNFVIWGLYFGFLLVLEKLFLLRILKRLSLINHVYTIFFILIGWVIFRADSFDHMFMLISQMFNAQSEFDIMEFQKLNIIHLWPYYILAIIGSIPLMKNIFKFLNKRVFIGIIYDVYLVAIFLICITYLITSSYNPFIYFRF